MEELLDVQPAEMYAIAEIQPIATRYIMQDGYISEETINLIYEFLESVCCKYDAQFHLHVLKNILEDAVDEALELFA